MSEDCRTCGTAMWELDEDLNCPGCSYRGKEDYDLLLTGLGTFCTSECTSSGELCKLLKENKSDIS